MKYILQNLRKVKGIAATRKSVLWGLVITLEKSCVGLWLWLFYLLRTQVWSLFLFFNKPGNGEHNLWLRLHKAQNKQNSTVVFRVRIVVYPSRLEADPVPKMGHEESLGGSDKVLDLVATYLNTHFVLYALCSVGKIHYGQKWHHTLWPHWQ